MRYEPPTLRPIGRVLPGATLSFGIASPIPTFNEMEAARARTWFTAKARQNAYNVAKQRAQLDVGYVALAAARARGLTLPLAGRLTVRCWWKFSLFDPDNQAAGIKVILDGLVEGKILANDRRATPGGMGCIGKIVHEFPDEDQSTEFWCVVQLTPYFFEVKQ